MKFIVRVDDQEKKIEITQTNGFFDLDIDGTPYRVDCRNFGDDQYFSLLIDNKSYLIESAALNADQGRYYANVMGRHYDVDVLDELMSAARKAAEAEELSGDYEVLSPMPGRIVDVKVAVGDKVAAGDALVVMEAMKMQNQLTTEIAGVVKEVLVKPESTVDSQAPLIIIERE